MTSGTLAKLKNSISSQNKLISGFFPSFLEPGPRPGKGRVAEWSKATDCKSVEVFLRRFESCLSHLFVVDFREEKRGIRQRRKANRAKLFLSFFGRVVK